MSSGLKEKREPGMGDASEGEGVYGRWELGVEVMESAGESCGGSRGPVGRGEAGKGSGPGGGTPYIRNRES